MSGACIKCGENCSACTVVNECISSGCISPFTYSSISRTCGKICSDKCAAGCV